MARRTWIAALSLTLAAGAGLVVTTPEGAVAAKKPPKPSISKVTPNSGSTQGGAVVKIKGKNLSTTTKVLFGKAKGTALKVKNDHKLVVTTPPHASGTVDVVVKTKGGKNAKGASARFVYADPKPQVTAVSPASGPTDGGTQVTVTGTGFVGVTSVSFDGVPGTGLSVVSTTQLKVTTPAHHPGVSTVNVTNAVGTSPSKSGAVFRFVSVPVSTIAPVPAGAAPNPGTLLAAVDCAPGDVCAAVGYYLTPGPVRRPLIETRTGTNSWVATDPGLPADSTPTNDDTRLYDVSCPTTTFCAALGWYKKTTGDYGPFVTTWNGSVWSAAQSVAMPAGGAPGAGSNTPVSALDCPSATTCVGVGFDYTGAVHRSVVLTMTAGVWSSQALTPPGSDSGLFDVSCGSDTSCVAVGAGDNGAGGQLPVIATSVGPVWTQTNPALPATGDTVTPDAFLAGVSCTGPGACTAVGSYRTTDGKYLGMIQQQGVVGWTPLFASGPPNAKTNPGIHLNDVSCSTGLGCAAVGGYDATDGTTRALVVRLDTGAVSPTEGPLPFVSPSAQTDLSGVACLTVTSCSAVGGFKDAAGHSSPLLQSLTNTGWSGLAAPAAFPAFDHGDLEAVATDDFAAVGVGRYVDTGGNVQGIITVDIPR